ncbi:hypothetical protein GCM10028857_26770 [Salinarchaeum chitinilyticum]
MPRRERVRGAIVEVAELLPKLGYEAHDVIGPVDEQGEDVPMEALEAEEELERSVQYYLTGSAGGANFYVMFELDKEFALIVYPMDVLRHLGSLLDEDEARQILDEPIDWDDVEPQAEDRLYRTAARTVVNNTDPEQFHRAAFTLSAQASTSIVDYHHTTTENGFPVEFQCARGMFPYTERLSIERLDNRLFPVRVAGERGRRYVEYSFHIAKEDREPAEYEFRNLI